MRNPKAKFKPAVDARGKPLAVGDTVLILSGRLEDYTVNVTGVDDDGEYCRVEVGYQHMIVPCKECVVRRKPVVANPSLLPLAAAAVGMGYFLRKPASRSHKGVTRHLGEKPPTPNRDMSIETKKFFVQSYEDGTGWFDSVPRKSYQSAVATGLHYAHENNDPKYAVREYRDGKWLPATVIHRPAGGWPVPKTNLDKLKNPAKGYHMPEAQARHTAEGLLARMLADGADTFAKKVKWVKRHMPNIDQPRTFVGWVTKGERGRVMRNPSPAYHRTRGDAELVLAEDSYRKAQTLRRRGDASGSHDALIHAHRMAALAEADLLDGASPKAADAKRLAWWKAYSGLAADKRRNPR